MTTSIRCNEISYKFSFVIRFHHHHAKKRNHRGAGNNFCKCHVLLPLTARAKVAENFKVFRTSSNNVIFNMKSNQQKKRKNKNKFISHSRNLIYSTHAFAQCLANRFRSKIRPQNLFDPKPKTRKTNKKYT